MGIFQIVSGQRFGSLVKQNREKLRISKQVIVCFFILGTQDKKVDKILKLSKANILTHM